MLSLLASGWLAATQVSMAFGAAMALAISALLGSGTANGVSVLA
jgi:hypothetical protein